ncbi:protein phosphatase 2C [Pelomyxa schiedti]|nr:protein phosphatase 2C [Pelomyxa schiedti]
MEHFPSETVASLAATLRHLVISGNSIRDLPRETLASLGNLMTLKAALNPLGDSGFPAHAFGLPSIITLDLARAGLRGECGVIDLHRPVANPTVSPQTPESTGTAAKSSEVGEKAVALPTSQPGSPKTSRSGTCHINYLILDHNKLRALPPNIGKIHELRTLNASFNRLTSIPDSLCSLCKLDTLILSDNRLTSLPDELPHLPFLATLDISNNPISAFPSSWFVTRNGEFRKNTWVSLLELDLTPATTLACLYISNNQLTTLPESLSSMVRLEQLDISCNCIAHCPSLTALARLSNFTAGYNPFLETPELPPSLIELNLSGCVLREQPVGTFSSLKKLYLSLNEFTSISENLVCSPQLGTLDVALNKLEVLPETCADYIIANRNSDAIQKTLPVHNSVSPCVNMCVGIADTLGRRLSMEDVICFEGQITSGADFIGLFDGHGGKEVADFVSATLPGYFIGVLRDNEEEVCKTAYQQTQVKCREYLGEDAEQKVVIQQVGTTALVALVWGDHIFMSNAGDSRAILWRKDHAIRLSRDHKPTDADEYKRIRDLGGFVTEIGRINGIIAVSRSFGDFFVQPLLNPEPYISNTKLTDDDRFLLLACDGVWDVLTDDKAGEIVNLALDAYGDDPEAAAYVLRDAAYLNGSTDNISVAVCLLKTGGTAKELADKPKTHRHKHSKRNPPRDPQCQAGLLAALRHAQSASKLKPQAPKSSTKKHSAASSASTTTTTTAAATTHHSVTEHTSSPKKDHTHDAFKPHIDRTAGGVRGPAPTDAGTNANIAKVERPRALNQKVFPQHVGNAANYNTTTTTTQRRHITPAVSKVTHPQTT